MRALTLSLILLSLQATLSSGRLQGQVIINEFLADPLYETAGDANGDGLRDPDHDDFIELLNVGSSSVNLSGFRIRDGFAVRHTFTSGTVLAPGQALVLFGGGSPQGWFGGAQVQTASTGTLSLSQLGDEIRLENGAGSVLQSLTYGPEGGLEASLTRNPDGATAPPTVLHNTPAASGGRAFSPGTRLNGVPFGASSNTLVRFFLTRDEIREEAGTYTLRLQLAQPSVANATTCTVRLRSGNAAAIGGFSETNVTFLPSEQGVKSLNLTVTENTEATGRQRLVVALEGVSGGNAAATTLDSFVLVIQDNDLIAALRLNEILADPPADASGDANRDGLRNAGEDSFLEFVNASSLNLDLSGYRLSDRSQLRHVFPAGTILPSGEAIVVFGGGFPTGSFGEALVQTASTGTLALTNIGDTIIVHQADGSEIIRYAYDDRAHNNQSITRWPDVLGSTTPMALHSEVPVASPTLFSPGSRADGTPFPNWLHAGEGPAMQPAALSLYPQPAHSELYVRVPESLWINGQANVFGPEGRLMAAITLEDAQTSLDVRDWPSGLYWLLVQNEQTVLRQPVLVQH
jgi:hypothetical protein